MLPTTPTILQRERLPELDGHAPADRVLIGKELVGQSLEQTPQRKPQVLQDRLDHEDATLVPAGLYRAD